MGGPVHWQKRRLHEPVNGSMPNDKIDDDIFIVYVEPMQKDCFIMWYDKTNEVILDDIRGLEPRHLLGAIRTSDNTMVLKNAAVIENMKENMLQTYKSGRKYCRVEGLRRRGVQSY